jgi:hypothetical protein
MSRSESPCQFSIPIVYPPLPPLPPIPYPSTLESMSYLLPPIPPSAYFHLEQRIPNDGIGHERLPVQPSKTIGVHKIPAKDLRNDNNADRRMIVELNRRMRDAERTATLLTARVANIEAQLSGVTGCPTLPVKSAVKIEQGSKKAVIDRSEEECIANALISLSGAPVSVVHQKTQPKPEKQGGSCGDPEKRGGSGADPDSKLLTIPIVKYDATATKTQQKRKRETYPVAITDQSMYEWLTSISAITDASSIHLKLAIKLGLQVDPNQPLRLSLPFTSAGTLLPEVAAKFLSVFRAILRDPADSPCGPPLMQHSGLRSWLIEAWIALLDDLDQNEYVCAFGFYALICLSASSNEAERKEALRIDVQLKARYVLAANPKVSGSSTTGGWPSRLIAVLARHPDLSHSDRVHILVRLVESLFASLSKSRSLPLCLCGHVPTAVGSVLNQLRREGTPEALRTQHDLLNIMYEASWPAKCTSTLTALIGIGAKARSATIAHIRAIINSTSKISASNRVVLICLDACLSASPT